MPYSDRAFRALVREQPGVLRALLDVALGPSVAFDGPVVRENVDDPHLDPPATIDADSVLRVGRVIVHTECQGYRDPSFEDRLFRYHLNLVLRFPGSTVQTIALWLMRPPKSNGLLRRRSGRPSEVR